jgi:hypothetical protein
VLRSVCFAGADFFRLQDGHPTVRILRTFAITAELWERLKTHKQPSEFAGAEDWIFASPIKLGRRPYSYTEWREFMRASESAKTGHPGTYVSLKKRYPRPRFSAPDTLLCVVLRRLWPR